MQVKCAVPEGQQSKCYDSDGNPYPPRPDGAYSGDHKPSDSAAGSAVGPKATTGNKNGQRPPSLVPAYWVCSADSSNPPNYDDTVITNPFKHGVEPDVLQHNVNSGDYVPIPEAGSTTLLYSQFIAWRNSTYRYNGDEYAWCMVFSSQEQAEAYVQKRKQTHDPYHQGSKFEIVDWSPK